MASLLRAVRRPQPKKPAMNNSCIEHTYASKNASAFFCYCGKQTYPDSIWEPIIKVTTNRNTQGAQTWEYHARCVRAFLDNPQLPSPSAAATLEIIQLANARHCVITGEKLEKGTKVVKLTNQRGKKSVVTLQERLEDVLASDPLSMQCAAENVIIDWIVRRSDLEPDVIRAKYEEKSTKRSFDKAGIELLNFFERLDEEREVFVRKICGDPFGIIEEVVNSEYLLFSARRLNNSAGTVFELVQAFLFEALEVEDRLAKKIGKSRSQQKKMVKWISTAVTHGYKLFNEEDFKLLRDNTILNEVGDVELISDNFIYADTLIEFFKFLCKYDKQKHIDNSEMVEHLTGTHPYIRQLCKHLQEQSGV